MSGGVFFDGSGDNTISVGNSSTANLAAAGVFTGTGEDVITYGVLTISVYASHAGSLTVQWSSDNSTWRADGDNYVIPPTTLKVFTYEPSRRYFRVVYTNGATLTTTLEIETAYRVSYTKSSAHRVGSQLTEDNDAELTKSVLVGYTPAGPYVNAKFSNVNEQQTADILDNGGTHGAITVGTSASLASVSGTNLANRKSLVIYNNGTVPIYFGHTNAVTTSTGIPVVVGEKVSFAVGPNTNVYLISGTASQNVRVTEIA